MGIFNKIATGIAKGAVEGFDDYTARRKEERNMVRRMQIQEGFNRSAQARANRQAFTQTTATQAMGVGNYDQAALSYSKISGLSPEDIRDRISISYKNEQNTIDGLIQKVTKSINQPITARGESGLVKTPSFEMLDTDIGRLERERNKWQNISTHAWGGDGTEALYAEEKVKEINDLIIKAVDWKKKTIKNTSTVNNTMRMLSREGHLMSMEEINELGQASVATSIVTKEKNQSDMDHVFQKQTILRLQDGDLVGARQWVKENRQYASEPMQRLIDQAIAREESGVVESGTVKTIEWDIKNKTANLFQEQDVLSRIEQLKITQIEDGDQKGFNEAIALEQDLFLQSQTRTNNLHTSYKQELAKVADRFYQDEVKKSMQRFKAFSKSQSQMGSFFGVSQAYDPQDPNEVRADLLAMQAQGQDLSPQRKEALDQWILEFSKSPFDYIEQAEQYIEKNAGDASLYGPAIAREKLIQSSIETFGFFNSNSIAGLATAQFYNQLHSGAVSPDEIEFHIKYSDHLSLEESQIALQYMKGFQESNPEIWSQMSGRSPDENLMGDTVKRYGVDLTFNESEIVRQSVDMFKMNIRNRYSFDDILEVFTGKITDLSGPLGKNGEIDVHSSRRVLEAVFNWWSGVEEDVTIQPSPFGLKNPSELRQDAYQDSVDMERGLEMSIDRSPEARGDSTANSITGNPALESSFAPATLDTVARPFDELLNDPTRDVSPVDTTGAKGNSTANQLLRNRIRSGAIEDPTDIFRS